jgi:hypothetical protein
MSRSLTPTTPDPGLGKVFVSKEAPECGVENRHFNLFRRRFHVAELFVP